MKLRGRDLAALFGLACGFWTPAGCSLIVTTEAVQCESDEDCLDRGPSLVCVDQFCVAQSASSTGGGTGGSESDGSSTGEPMGPWSCLGGEPPPKPQPMPGTTHIYRGQILDTITQLPPPDTVLRLCDALDIECMTPIGDDIIPNAEGIYEATVPSGFEGYFEITSSTTVPQILWIPGVVTEDVLDIGVPLQLVSPGIRDTLISTAGFEYDETRGIVLLVATDCNEDPAAGISFGLSTSDTETIVFYLYNLLPQLEVDGTDESGFGGFFNAPTGISTMTATRNETSELIAEQQFLIRAGWISAVAAGAGGGLQ